MNILKVKFQLLDGWEGIDAFLSRMYAFGRLAIVQRSDVSVKMCFPFLSVEKLMHPRGSWKRRNAQAERTVPWAGKGSAVEKRIAFDA